MASFAKRRALLLGMCIMIPNRHQGDQDGLAFCSCKDMVVKETGSTQADHVSYMSAHCGIHSNNAVHGMCFEA